MFVIRGSTAGSTTLKDKSLLLNQLPAKVHNLFLLSLKILPLPKVVEKAEIGNEVMEEDKRLDCMMEMERVKALREYEEREQARREERLKGAHVLQQQIVENEQFTMLEQEKKDQETRAMLQVGWQYHWFTFSGVGTRRLGGLNGC